jgi:ubiquinone/menaquinone biosynthesis C-methylase UbiE
MPNYGDKKYWDKRYNEQQNKTYDWLEGFERLRTTIENSCKKDSKILMLGCGNALLSEDMYKNGYENIYNIDISSVVIDQMKERNKDMVNMKYEVMDALNMQYPDNTFDAVIDKSTIDAILCGDESYLNTARMMKEVQRVLKVGGYYVVISYGIPENRVLHFEREHTSWELKYFTMEKAENDNSGTHHCYVARKNPDADIKSKENWESVEKYLILEEEREKLLDQFRAPDSEEEDEKHHEEDKNKIEKPETSDSKEEDEIQEIPKNRPSYPM